jgi:hypothetical protein
MSAAAGRLQRTAAIAATLANPKISGLFVIERPSMSADDDATRQLPANNAVAASNAPDFIARQPRKATKLT